MKILRVAILLFVLGANAAAQNPNTAAFPGAVATDTDLLVQSNSAQTTLDGGIDDTTLAINLTSAAEFTFPGVITIDLERIKVCSKSTNALTVCSAGRGFGGTAAAAHLTGADVYGYATAHEHNQLAAEIKAMETALGASLANVVLSTVGMTQAVENSADNSVSVGVGTSGRAFEKTPFTIDPATGDSSTPGTISSGSAGTVAGELELYELGSNGSNFRSWLAPDAITADLQLKHADGLPAGSVMTFPTPTGTVSQYSWTNYAEAATASTIPIRDSSGHLIVAAEAYDATGWDADAGVPQKDAVRDKFEALAPSGVIASSALSTAHKTRNFSCVFDGGGSTVTDNSICYVRLPVAGTITGWSVVAVGSSPACTADVLKVAAGTALPTASIAGSAPPALTSTDNAVKSTTLTDWTTAITADDIAAIKITEPGAATWVEVVVYYTES